MFRRISPGCVLLLLFALVATSLRAQQKSSVAGDYAGTLGPLRVKLHIVSASDGTFSGTLDSPDQGANGIPCSDFRLDGKSLSFAAPRVQGTWKGSVAEGARTLVGDWSQGGASMALTFTREQPFVAAAKPSAVDGIWLGTIKDGSDTLRTQVKVKSDNTGKEYCTLDSLDQDVSDLPCANVVFAGDSFSFVIPSAHAKWSGILSPDGKKLTGTWVQGDSTPLNFARQATALIISPPAPPSYAPAMPTYLEANLHPGRLPASAATSSDGKTLAAALAQSHELHAEAMPGTRIALAWLYAAEPGNYWHNGATGGLSSYAFFNPKADDAAVVLVNMSVGRTGSLADIIGEHIFERLSGKPAINIQ